MRIDNEKKLDYSNVLLRPKRSTLGSRKSVSVKREFSFRNYQYNGHPKFENDKHYKGIPIMAANMDGVGTMRMADELAQQGIFTCLVKGYSEKELINYFTHEPDQQLPIGLRAENVAMSIGILPKDLEKFSVVSDACGQMLKYVCVDVANGYSERFVEFVSDLRMMFPSVVIIAGNVVTGEMTEELLLNGADMVKVGIGPGSVCTTRIQTGVGYPQLSAVIECADAAHGLDGHIIADGGCTSPGDVAKAFAAGADFVMLGGMLAGHDEGGGEIITKHYLTDEIDESKYKNGLFGNGEQNSRIVREEKFVQFYGMSSEIANNKHFGGLKDYRASEGKEVTVPYKGKVKDTIQEILGGLRSACTYVGANKLKQLSKCTTFIQCYDTHNRVYE